MPAPATLEPPGQMPEKGHCPGFPQSKADSSGWGLGARGGPREFRATGRVAAQHQRGAQETQASATAPSTGRDPTPVFTELSAERLGYANSQV